MRVLIVGDCHLEIYEDAIYNSFKKLGHNTRKFCWSGYFNNLHNNRDGRKLIHIGILLQNKFKLGPILNRISRNLISVSEEYKPDLIFIYRGTHIYPETVRKMKRTGAFIFGYNNDDPFSHKYPGYFWRHYRNCLPHYDFIYAYREKNLQDYKEMGLTNLGLLRSYYIEEKNCIIKDRELIPKELLNDVVFIGHFENDGRDSILKYLIDNGINVRIFGPLWEKSEYYSQFLSQMETIEPLYGDEYNLALNGAKIALVFFSRLNNDTYTRRCFEIPAAGTLMISEYTDDMNELFESDKEAVYYRKEDELLQKVKYYLDNPEIRARIAENGHKKLASSAHEVTDRVRMILEDYNRIRYEG